MGSFSEHWPLYLVLTSFLGEMLDVARHGPHGGKLGLVCQGWYVWLIQKKQNQRVDHYMIRNIDANSTLLTDSLCEIHVRSRRCLETNMTRGSSVEECRVYIYQAWDIRCHLSRYVPETKQATSDWLTAHHASLWIPGSYTQCTYTQQDSAGIEGACWLSLIPCWLVPTIWTSALPTSVVIIYLPFWQQQAMIPDIHPPGLIWAKASRTTGASSNASIG